MKKFTIYILTVFFIFNFAHSEIIKKVVINGNKRVSEETVKIYGEIEINKDYKEKDINKILNNLYETEFFQDVKISISQNSLIINLKEFPVINQLVIVGEPSKKYKDQIKKNIKSKEKRSFVKSNLAKDIDIIKTLYSSLGYNFAEVDAKIKQIDDDNFDLLITIKRGDQTKISNINFIGNENIRSSRLKDIIASEEDKFWKFLSKNTNFSENLINLDIRLLRNYYKSLGFYDVKINSNLAQLTKTGKADLTYSIDEGSRYTINKISTNVDKVFDKQLFFPLKQTYQKYIGEYYSPFKVKNILEDLDKLIDDNNLQFVEHNVQEIIEGNSINIIFNIFEGKKILVERINVLGNTITNEDVIRGELIVDEGDPFTKLNLDKSVAEIKARNIFRSVNSKISDGSEENLKIIDIIVEEQPTGEVSAGAGVGTSGGNFIIGVKENNWLGEGKSVAFNLEVDEESIRGLLNYTDPNYDFLGNSLSYRLKSEKNDKPDQGYENSVVSAGVGTAFEQYKDVVASLGLDLSYDDLRTNSSASSSLKKQEGTFNEFSGNYGFSYDQRNRAFMPTSGSIVSFGQSIPIYADKSSVSSTFTASKYKSLNDNIVGAGKIYLSAVNGLGSDDVRLSKRKSLSGKRLRGFERNKIGPVDGADHIGGNYAAAVNLESNLPNLLPDDFNTDISFFLDFGSVWGVDYDKSLNESNKLRSSTGVVANFLSPIGPVSFILSQNLSKADTDKTESFTFNIGTTF